jgi:hypothetical protein
MEFFIAMIVPRQRNHCGRPFHGGRSRARRAADAQARKVLASPGDFPLVITRGQQ